MRTPAYPGSASADHPSLAEQRGWHLKSPNVQHAALVASWSRSADDARRWVSNATHPFQVSEVTTWCGMAGTCSHGCSLTHEVCRSRTARSGTTPTRTRSNSRGSSSTRSARQGVGRLLTRARRSGRTDCFLRVAPDNSAALALYHSTGFYDVDSVQADAWNQQQPVGYVWLQHLPGGGWLHLRS